MDAQLEHANCLICGGSDTEVFIRGCGPRHIVRCRRDGLLYLNPRPAATELRGFQTRYVRHDNLEFFDSFRKAVLAREANAIKRFKKSGDLLDVGCATGTLFASFVGCGWRLFGVETSPVGARLARQRYGADVFCGTLRDAAWPSGSFDVVCVLDTLYYIPDPRRDLIEIKRVLKQDGLLAVEIPGLRYRLLRDRGIVCWLLDRRWRRMSPDCGHLYYFSPRTLCLLLESIGFRLITMVPEQASLGRRGVLAGVNHLHFSLARLLFAASGGRLSIAAKELYLAVKVA